MSPAWFGRRRSGWNFRPVSWAGWAVTALYGLLVYEAARTFRPMRRNAVSALLARTAAAAAVGQYEPFKTTTGFDGTAHHPQWLG